MAEDIPHILNMNQLLLVRTILNKLIDQVNNNSDAIEGGGGVSASKFNGSDADFHLYSDDDPSRTMSFNLANIPGQASITLYVPGFTGTLALDNVFDDENNGLVPRSPGVSGLFLSSDKTWINPAGAFTDGDKGDIIVSDAGTTWLLDYPSVNVLIAPSWLRITDTPTTLAGYGITDAQPFDADLAAFAAIVAGSDNFLQSKAGAWVGRTIAQVKADLGLAGANSGDQTITLTGDVTGTGTGSFITTLKTSNPNVGSFGSATQGVVLTVNAKGLVTAASIVTITPAFSSITGKPTTLAGYGITDGLTQSSADAAYLKSDGSATCSTCRTPASRAACRRCRSTTSISRPAASSRLMALLA